MSTISGASEPFFPELHIPGKRGVLQGRCSVAAPLSKNGRMPHEAASTRYSLVKGERIVRFVLTAPSSWYMFLVSSMWETVLFTLSTSDLTVSHEIQDPKIKRVDIEPIIEIPIKDMPGGVDMSTRMSPHLHLRIIRNGPVLHALRQPQELPHTVGGLECGHVGRVSVADVEDSAIVVDFTAEWEGLRGGAGGVGDGDVDVGGDEEKESGGEEVKRG
ncbi:hypothetical protein Drorol1_Dr00015407 [Drosera rotundifolia]